MLGGAVVVAVCLLLLGWTSEVVGLFVHDVEKVCPVLEARLREGELMSEGYRNGVRRLRLRFWRFMGLILLLMLVSSSLCRSGRHELTAVV
jgi:hypothetical protein